MKTASPKFLPYGRQSISEEDIRMVADVLRGEFLTTGPMVTAFEACIADYAGGSYVSVCANGTAGLHMAVAAAGVGNGDIVIVPSVTFLATANAVVHQGGEVIFADVDPRTGLMMPEHFERALAKAEGRPVKAVIPVHLNGQVGDPEGIRAIADQHEMVIIEDACHALGTSYFDAAGRRHMVGSCAHSDMVVFSFHPVKTLTTGEGGAVSTNSSLFFSRLNLFRNHGMTRDSNEFSLLDEAWSEDGLLNTWFYEMQQPGLNYRLTDVQCALGISQMKRLPQFIEARSKLVSAYDKAFASSMKWGSEILAPIHRNPNCDAGWHLYVLQIDFSQLGKTRASVMKDLRLAGVGTQVHYFPVHLQPYYQKISKTGLLPGALEYYSKALSIPLFPHMTEDDMRLVVESVLAIFEA